MKNKKLPDQIRLPLPLKQAIEDEAKRLSRIEQSTVTQSEVVNRSWRFYRDNALAQKVTPDASVLKSEQDQLGSPKPVVISPKRNINSDKLHELASDLSEPERKFLGECLRIYRSDFSRPLQENVTFFGIGLSAVEQIAAMRVAGERAPVDADALTPREQRASKIADDAENEVNLLKKATHDVTEELRRSREGNSPPEDGVVKRHKGRPRKTGSGGGD